MTENVNLSERAHVSNERTLVLVKPDGVQRGLTGEIISRLERRGLRVLAAKMLQPDEALTRLHYAAHVDKGFFPGLMAFFTSSPIMALVFEGQRAVEVARQVSGATDPVEAAPGTIRGDLALDKGQNLIHASDGVEAAVEEIALYFRADEVLSYERDVDRWITGS
ncbi:MAG: nucleoside-diphosphate kinase [Chloroflexi bacterium]|nr:MAG: nucleoside-diphosphate kinase [Chloroflexota bacterium]